MSVKIRLARVGRRRAPYYRIVTADSRRARDGRFIEIIGRYQPLQKEGRQFLVDEKRALRWLGEGAIPSDTVRSIFRKLGIMRKFHEQRLAGKRAAVSSVTGADSQKSAAAGEPVTLTQPVAPHG